MEIHEFRAVVRASNFERTCRFYGEIVGLPRLESAHTDRGRSAVFRAGTGVVEVLGRPEGAEGNVRDVYSLEGPDHKMTLTLTVPSAEQAYEEMIFREKNIPGGLETGPDGRTAFVTHDPDGVKVVLTEK